MKCIILKKSKIVITNIIIYFCIFALLTNSKSCITSITNSTDIFLTKLLPALLPFLIITELILNLNIAENLTYGFSHLLSKVFHVPLCATPTIIMAYLFGYPNAAKYICKLHSNNKLEASTIQKLSKFTNNASPAYIVVSIGIAMYNEIRIGIILLISHITASILIGIFPLPNKNIIQQNNTNSNSFKKISFSFEILLISLINSIKTLCIIWGFTVIFSLVPAIILDKFHLPYTISAVITGIFELSSGINLLANNNTNLILDLCLISFILSFSSLMVILQIYSYLYKTGITLTYLIKYKLLHGFISSIITYILIKTFFNTTILTTFSSTDNYILTNPVPHYIYFTIAILTIFLLYLKKKR